jgi:CRISPR type III-A-associated protein Csm2
MNQPRDRQSTHRSGQNRHGIRHDAGGQRQPQPVEHLEQLWRGYLEGGYFDADGNLRLEYVGRDKVEPLVAAMARAQPPLTQGQLRRFFQHCRRIETRLKTGQATWAHVRPQVAFLDAAAQDAYGKQPRKIPALFREFIQRNIEAVHSERDLRDGFLPHFEALVGFGALHIQRDRN